MKHTRTTRLLCAAAFALSIGLGTAHSSFADDPSVIPAGIACYFPVKVESSGGNRVDRIFKDKTGYVRMLSAGTGAALTLTNVENGKSLSLQSNGAVLHTTINPDGSQTVVANGHNVIILWPSDIPKGPSMTLYVGRVLYSIDPFGTWTVNKVSGTQTDLCAALSSN